jgi:hypothetical protein
VVTKLALVSFFALQKPLQAAASIPVNPTRLNLGAVKPAR